MDLINKINSAQRQEAIDEDKKISKRALDSEFAFVKRIGEDSIPPSNTDKRVGFSINRYIQEIKNNLEATLLNVQEDLAQERKQEKKVVSFDIGKTINLWNELVIYMKSYRPMERLTNKDITDFWELASENLLPLIYQIDAEFDTQKVLFDATGAEESSRSEVSGSTGYSTLASEMRRAYEDEENEAPEDVDTSTFSGLGDVIFPEYPSFKKLQNYIENKNLSLISSVQPQFKELAMQRAPTLKSVPSREAVLAQERRNLEEARRRAGVEVLRRGQAREGLPAYADERMDAVRQIESSLRDRWMDLQRMDISRRERERVERALIAQARDFLDEVGADREVIENLIQRLEVVGPEDAQLGAPPAGGLFGPDEGWGKPRKNKRVSKKKMGDDEVQLEIEFEDKKQLNHNDKSMKKPVKKKYMVAFDDSKDSNYLK
jgi:hypothetical protein